MWFKNKLFATIVSISLVNWCSEDGSKANNIWSIPKESSLPATNIQQKSNNHKTMQLEGISWTQKKANQEICVCLETDGQNSFTHTKVLENVNNPHNTILEFPISQLFKKYWDNDHPLSVSWVDKNFRALLWRNWVENLKVPQKFKSRKWWITSDTNYEIWDTIRFQLINPLLKWAFPETLSEQLKEEWFQTFSDTNSSIIVNKSSKSLDGFYSKKSKNFTYDIVVKKLPSWRYALALYRDWNLFMATYASVGINNDEKRTVTWQFNILKKEPYKRSYKYDNAPMPEALKFYKGFYIHQWNVTQYPASHWCIRIPGVYASILYSLVKDHTVIYIDKNLNKSKK